MSFLSTEVVGCYAAAFTFASAHASLGGALGVTSFAVMANEPDPEKQGQYLAKVFSASNFVIYFGLYRCRSFSPPIDSAPLWSGLCSCSSAGEGSSPGHFSCRPEHDFKRGSPGAREDLSRHRCANLGRGSGGSNCLVLGAPLWHPWNGLGCGIGFLRAASEHDRCDPGLFSIKSLTTLGLALGRSKNPICPPSVYKSPESRFPQRQGVTWSLIK